MNGYIKLENRTLEACAHCGGLMVKKHTNQLYCTRSCLRKAEELVRASKLEAARDRLAFRFCENCGVVTGKNPRTRWCKKCAPEMYKVVHRSLRYKEQREIHLMMHEYHYLLVNSDVLSKMEFIRLLSIAEMLGRDLEEWVSENEHLRWLQAGMQEEQRLFDAGEKRKTDYKDIPKDGNHQWESLDNWYLRTECTCQYCKAGKEAAMKRKYGGGLSEGTQGGNPVSEPQGGADADGDNQHSQGDKEAGAGCDAGRVAEPNREKKKEEKVI